MAPTGDIIGLDYTAVEVVVRLYTKDVRKVFESVLMCYRMEQEFSK